MNTLEEVLKRRRKFAVFPIVCADHCARLLNMNFGDVINDGEKLAQVLDYGYKTYGYDMVLVFCDPYVEAEALGCEVEFTPYPRLIKALWLNSVETKSERIDRTGEIINAAKLLKDKLTVPVFVSIKGPFSLAAFLVGIENFLRMLIKSEKKVKEIIDHALGFQMGYLKRLLLIGVNVFIGDPLSSTSVVSPKIFTNFAYEPLKKLVKKAKDHGVIAGIHICGDTRPIISMLDRVGADILSIEDITPETKTLKMGGVKTDTILNGNRTKIEYEIKEALKQPYLLLSTSCDVPMETNPENIKAMMNYGINS